MYLVGAPHAGRDLLEWYLRDHVEGSFVTSAEVYQELIHRYVAIDRRRAIADAFDFLDALVEDVFPVAIEDVRRAHQIAMRQRSLSGRDVLHLAVMESRGIDTVLSLDRGFDLWPGIHRVPEI